MGISGSWVPTSFLRGVCASPLALKVAIANFDVCSLQSRNRRRNDFKFGYKIISTVSLVTKLFHERFPHQRGVEVLCFLPSAHNPLYDFDLRATHARTLLPVGLASVSFGFVLVWVRVNMTQDLRLKTICLDCITGKYQPAPSSIFFYIQDTYVETYAPFQELILQGPWE